MIGRLVVSLSFRLIPIIPGKCEHEVIVINSLPSALLRFTITNKSRKAAALIPYLFAGSQCSMPPISGMPLTDRLWPFPEVRASGKWAFPKSCYTVMLPLVTRGQHPRSIRIWSNYAGTGGHEHRNPQYGSTKPIR